jgi:HD-GYP domain-containing protein (c-di-GMP phosphodiesterase class II)
MNPPTLKPTMTAEDLLAGASLSHEVTIPESVRAPSGAVGDGASVVRLRPLTIEDLQVVTRTAKEQDVVVAALMVQRSLMEPKLSLAQVLGLHAGLVEFLLAEVNRISGISAKRDEIRDAASAPVARAASILARTFGWTPEQVSALTLGQVLLHLEMLREQE